MAIYTHQLNPIAFYLAGTPVPWYWLNYIFGFSFVYFVSLYLTRQKISPLLSEDLHTYALVAWLGVIIFGRLGYVFIYRWPYYRENPELIYQIWLGGMSFHGALVGCAFMCILSSFKKKQPFFLATDLFSLLIPIPLALGRITNFVNAELIGRPTGGSWGVIFPYDSSQVPRHPSQLYQASLEGILLFIILWQLKAHLKTPGLMTGYFLLGYGTLRIISECFRMPDKSLGYLFGVFSMGQLLCFLMIFFAIIILWCLKISQGYEISQTKKSPSE
ncbi:MAG: prolipoprotein diacylglyceryl transferase [Proteobacteria bacterium]|nr:prolipoprotein diacylglyceryl transferase [Pseudomonadota bacterium]